MRLLALLPSALLLLLLDCNGTLASVHDRQDETDRATNDPRCEDAKVLSEAAFGAEEDSFAVLRWSRGPSVIFRLHTSCEHEIRTNLDCLPHRHDEAIRVEMSHVGEVCVPQVKQSAARSREESVQEGITEECDCRARSQLFVSLSQSDRV